MASPWPHAQSSELSPDELITGLGGMGLQGSDALGAWTLVSAGAVEDQARRGKGAALSGLRCLWGQGGRMSRLPQPGLMLFPFTQLSQSRQGKPPLKQPACSSSEVHRPVRGAAGGKSTWRCQRHQAQAGTQRGHHGARPGAQLDAFRDLPSALWGWGGDSQHICRTSTGARCQGRGGGGQDGGWLCGTQHWPGGG